MNKKKIVFLASGNGGNFHFIHEVIKKNYLQGFQIIELIVDRKCGAQEIAKLLKIKCSIIDFKELNQKSLLDRLISISPDLIITNVHRILKEPIIQAFDKKLINLHYSLLPSYGGFIGMRPVKEALKFNEKYIGVTTHFAEKEVDQGKQIAQICFFNNYNEELSSKLENIIFRCGCFCLLAAIYNKPTNDEILLDILGVKCSLNGSKLPPNYIEINDELWKIVQNQIT
jgi:phosphoribosylglycinamide formyltransferase 1